MRFSCGWLRLDQGDTGIDEANSSNSCRRVGAIIWDDHILPTRPDALVVGKWDAFSPERMKASRFVNFNTITVNGHKEQ